MGFSLYDFRDLDLMLQLQQIGDNDGWASTKELGEALGAGDDVRGVGIRASWMKRLGMFDFDDETRMWRVSEGGERVTKAKLRAAASNSIEKTPDDALVDVMAHVTSRYRHGDPLMATMLRREFLYGTSPRTRWNGGKK
jgi:hypothetical protein